MAAEAQSEAVDVGRVLANAFRTIRRNALGFVALSFLLGGIPNVAAVYLDHFDSFEAGGSDRFFPLTLFGSMLLSLFAGALLQAALVGAVVNDLGGRDADLPGSTIRGLSLAFPLVGLVVASSIAIGLGLVLFVVPGLIWTTMWSVAVPAMVEERTGVYDSLARSAELTRGSRWPIFGLLAIYYGLWFALDALLVMVIPNPYDDLLVYALAVGVIAAVIGLFSAAVFAALYVELKAMKEGGGKAGLAAVLD